MVVRLKLFYSCGRHAAVLESYCILLFNTILYFPKICNHGFSVYPTSEVYWSVLILSSEENCKVRF
jgi:hypothetical protein